MEKSKNGGWKHRLSNINLESMTADCAYCGIEVAIVAVDKVRCAKGRKKSGVYGDIKLTYEEREEMFNQDSCPICNRPLEFDNATLDHCHDTNALRGFLCQDCNLGLGKFRDEIDTLYRAIEYLKGNIGRIKHEAV